MGIFCTAAVVPIFVIRESSMVNWLTFVCLLIKIIFRTSFVFFRSNSSILGRASNSGDEFSPN